MFKLPEMNVSNGAYPVLRLRILKGCEPLKTNVVGICNLPVERFFEKHSRLYKSISSFAYYKYTVLLAYYELCVMVPFIPLRLQYWFRRDSSDKQYLRIKLDKERRESNKENIIALCILILKEKRALLHLLTLPKNKSSVLFAAGDVDEILDDLAPGVAERPVRQHEVRGRERYTKYHEQQIGQGEVDDEDVRGRPHSGIRRHHHDHQ
ncbi:hypothetical protein PUN28_019109 [Cardiocondyla obscurior]|uniref:Uncharacterized protein n=1 Tax=Cardiocondyla obscurior TaxID=286306 RepID=A0AAW2EFJ5_9HYME